MKKVISFSLWGEHPKYTIGAIKNADQATRFYPDWICRFYVAKNVPTHIIQELLARNNTEVFIVNEKPDWSGMFWRFFAACDPFVDVMISRDTDSRLGEREMLAVKEWENSDRGFHIMRDHPQHGATILGGMWGIKKGLIQNMADLIENYQKGDFHQVDQNFLREIIYPLIRDNVLVHDPIFDKKPFPSQRVDYQFVGQVFDEHDQPVMSHLEELKRFLQSHQGYHFDDRFVNFERDHYEGQMMPEERRALYNIVLEKKPERVFEIGTWKGGGSTYFIAHALKKNGKGTLYTIEVDHELFDHARNLYETRLKSLKPYIRFHLGKSDEVYPNILKDIANIDMIFLDGAEDAEQTVKEFRLFLPKLAARSVVACHDWNIHKMEKLRLLLESDPQWKCIALLLDTLTGFAAWEKVVPELFERSVSSYKESETICASEDDNPNVLKISPQGIERFLSEGYTAIDLPALKRDSLTVITACYNHSEYLDAQFRSLLRQTIPPDEVIFVHDCSPDNTLAVLTSLVEEYKNITRTRFKIINNEENIGFARSLNRGIEAATSDLIMIVDDDDALFTDTVEVMRRLFHRHKHVALFGAHHVSFNDDRCLEGENLIRHASAYEEIPLTFHLPEQARSYRKSNDINMTHSGSTFLKAAWTSVGKYRIRHERVVDPPDRDFQVRMNLLYPVAISYEIPFSFWRSNSRRDPGALV